MNEKKKTILEIGLVFLALLAVEGIALIVFPLAPNSLVKQLIKYALYALMTGAVIGVCRLRGLPLCSALGFSRERIGRQILLALPAFAVTAFLFVVLPLLLGVPAASWLGSRSADIPGAILSVIFYMLFVGPGEEIIFRGYMLGRFQELTGSGVKAVIFSSILFGLWHFPVGQDFLQVILTTLIGLIWGFARLRIKDCTTLSLSLAHGLHDTFILFLGYILM